MKIYKYLFGVVVAFFALSSCEETLDLEPRGENLTSGEVLSDPASYDRLAAKVYAGLILGGQEGGDGNADIGGIDGGFSNYLRIYWQHQELSSDEALIAWDDGTIKDFQRQTWSDSNEFINAMYSRVNYQIALANDFIRNSSEASLDSYGIPESERETIRAFRTEVRFLRAYSYYHGMDLFGSMPFKDENSDPNALAQNIERADLFNYIESELLDIEDEIAPARTNEYGRADQATVWMTLAKIYLNAEVYTGTSRYTEVVDYTTKVINAGYSVDTSAPYANLFLADNDSNGSQNEFIWTLNFDGQRTQTFGGTTFLTHAPVGGDMDPDNFGINGGWFGIRTTPQFVELFPGEENSADGRELFFTENQTKQINNESQFSQGFAIAKYKNVDVNGVQGSDATGDFVDIDFPVYRLADAYLMYAEGVLRGGGGSTSLAVDYINILRERAYGNSGSNITAGDLNLDFILDERGRELYWETHRRQDLIRFNQFSSNGVWAWKGNVATGTTTSSFRDLFPIPARELNLNDNLVQNPGY
ncbi:membrane protein [Nonlabens sp. YIK11]|uniref:RagB/SusD family nutrient uptake outer membrane protein n=1 Tax=Nonlabens sp. YIK11 TaxID=1453349 RepID=UPI0006DCE473|nr:RagB/SusD family nutrient uptake outer membrane protein [Nonlabens sp. YIK11]KQC32001.1 membrane protein [Nonlabens sp. YIK11]